MTKKQMEEQLNFEIQCKLISEIAKPEIWTGKDVITLEDEEIQEITAGDEKPFYVEIVALYEDMSGNSRIYGRDAVNSCKDAMVGVNMYKGHEEPGTEGWKYREPVGKIVAARTDTITLPDGKKVLAAIGKAYITEADPKLRSDIKKKMAGSVSILGRAKMVRQVGETVKTVTHLHKPLKSVDFCNPGTGGLSHAGVTAVVSEMAGATIESTAEDQDTEDKEMTVKKLTKEELLNEYKPEITALVGEQVEAQIQEIAAGRRKNAEDREAFKDEKTKLDGQIAEMKTAVQTANAERDSWKQKFEAERDARIASELQVFATAHVAEMKGLDGANEKIIDMAAKRVKVAVVDGDLEKSKIAFSASLKASIEEISELSEMFGGGDPEQKPSGEEKPKRQHRNNPGKKTGDLLNKVLAPSLLAARDKK